MQTPSSGLLRSVVWKKFTDVSEMLAASILTANVFGKLLPGYIVKQSGRRLSLY
jgi:fluoride ion exporter CrcB/FEX